MDNQNFQNSNYQDNTTNMQYQPTPPSYQENEPKGTNVLAILGLVFGILSILACCFWYIALILGIVGLVCSIASKKHSKTGLATAGIVCSIIGIVLCIVLVVFAVLVGTSDVFTEMMNSSYYGY